MAEEDDHEYRLRLARSRTATEIITREFNWGFERALREMRDAHLRAQTNLIASDISEQQQLLIKRMKAGIDMLEKLRTTPLSDSPLNWDFV